MEFLGYQRKKTFMTWDESNNERCSLRKKKTKEKGFGRGVMRAVSSLQVPKAQNRNFPFFYPRL